MIISVACSVLLVKASKAKEPEAVPSLISFRPKFVKVPLMFGDSPNIIGGVHTIDDYANGAFHRYGSFQGTVGSGDDVITIDSELRASNFDALFGKSTTVQPASVCLLPCIKS